MTGETGHQNSCTTRTKKSKPCLYYQIESVISSPLQNEPPSSADGTLSNKNELGTLLISAIKFFLFQRTQIPLPFERLRNNVTFNAEANLTTVEDNEEQVKETESVRLPFGSDTRPVVTNCEENKEIVKSGRQRLLYLREQRKQKITQKRLANLSRKYTQDERNVRQCWDKIFIILQETLGLMNYGDLSVVGVLLMFGQTILNPRETILFQLDPHLISNVSPPNLLSEEHPDTISSTIRKFFKSIIMSTEFPDFTSKPLPRTYTHLCVLTRSPIPESSWVYNELIHLNDFVLPGNRNCTTHSSTGKPLFHIKLKLGQGSNGNLSCYNELETENILEKTSFLCYQIPCKFKGIQWRNK